jgi:hypothetical protein
MGRYFLFLAVQVVSLAASLMVSSISPRAGDSAGNGRAVALAGTEIGST